VKLTPPEFDENAGDGKFDLISYITDKPKKYIFH